MNSELLLTYQLRTLRPSAARRAVSRAWTRAIIRGDWARADALFAHLWPGVLPELPAA